MVKNSDSWRSDSIGGEEENMKTRRRRRRRRRRRTSGGSGGGRRVWQDRRGQVIGGLHQHRGASADFEYSFKLPSKFLISTAATDDRVTIASR